MKTLFLKTKCKEDLTNLFKKIKLKGKTGLVCSAPYSTNLKKANEIIKNSAICGEITGCNLSYALNKKVDSYLFIGSSYFHPIELRLKTNKEVYLLNPLTSKLSKVSNEEIKTYKKRKKGKLLKFLAAEKIGIIISTKPGQYHPNKYLNLKQKINLALKMKNKLKKESYIFIANNINGQELENFPDIQAWINTACPKIEYKNIINLQDLKI